MKTLPGGRRPFVAFATSRAHFEAAGKPDPADHLGRIAAAEINKPLDLRTVEQKIGAIIKSNVNVRYQTGAFYTEYGERKRVSSQGGGVTVEPDESPSGDVEIFIDPRALGG